MFKRDWVLPKILVHHFAQKQETWPGELWYNMDGTKRPSHGWADIERERIMAIKIGINGFGRIGRVVLRILAEQPDKYEVCGINLRKADVDYMVYLLKYDSVFRRFNGTVEHEGGDLVVNGHKIRVFSQSDAAMIPWSECGAEYIIESTGANNTTEKASRHFKGGARKVLLTAPAKDEVPPPLYTASTASCISRT